MNSDYHQGRRPSRNQNNRRSPEENQQAQRIARKKYLDRRRRKKKIRRILRYIYIILFIIAVVTFLAVFVFKTPIERGTESLKAGRYEEAIERFSEGLNDIDYIAESYKGIGIAYYELGQYKDAVDNLENAIQKGQNSLGSTYYILSISYMELENYENALKNITLGLTKTGNTPELIKEMKFNEVLCMELTSDWEGAKAKATSYMLSYPEDAQMSQELEFLITR